MVIFDDEAKQWISKGRLPPSPAGKDFYYYIDGFQDHRVFYSYNDESEQLEATAIKLTGKPLNSWATWNGMTPGAEAPKPGSEDKHLLTPLYDPSAITNGRRFVSKPESDGWEVIIDLDRHRILYHHWDT